MPFFTETGILNWSFLLGGLMRESSNMKAPLLNELSFCRDVFNKLVVKKGRETEEACLNMGSLVAYYLGC